MSRRDYHCNPGEAIAPPSIIGGKASERDQTFVYPTQYGVCIYSEFTDTNFRLTREEIIKLYEVAKREHGI